MPQPQKQKITTLNVFPKKWVKLAIDITQATQILNAIDFWAVPLSFSGIMIST